MSMDKVIAFIFTLAGITMLSVGILLFSGYEQLAEHGIKSPAEVVETINSGSKGCYQIVLGWRLKNGKYVKHKLEDAANFGPRKGDRVEIAYDEHSPTNLVIINDARSLFVPLCTGFMGSVFSFFGLSICISLIMKLKQNNWLQRNGAIIACRFKTLVIDPSRSVNGVTPWKVVVCGRDPRTGRELSFESEAVWQDPSRYLRECPIDVYVDPANTEKYYVDLSFLGKKFFDYRTAVQGLQCRSALWQSLSAR